MKQIIDNFSSGSDSYALYRPMAPEAVYDFLYGHVRYFNTAWDCGTGNGQVAVRLAERFTNVIGTDISAEQLARAERRSNITYLQGRAETATLTDHSINLITIAQAIHWFDFDAFYSEVRRVAVKDAFIAAWTYTLLHLTPAIDEVIYHLYTDITGSYWDPERGHVDANYTTIPFPFAEVQAPAITITLQRDFKWLLGYLRTWSGVTNYVKRTGNDPVSIVEDDLRRAWGDVQLHEVNFPVCIRAGFIR